MRRRYGSSPIHLLAHLAAFALAGYALLQILDARGARDVVIWFVAAVVLHDVLLLPAYSALDRAAQRITGPAVNYLRVPVILSALLLLAFFPVISGKGEGAFRATSGLAYDGYLERWLLVSGALFAGSLAWWAIRGRGSARPAPPAP
jgi:hypothetical protein